MTADSCAFAGSHFRNCLPMRGDDEESTNRYDTNYTPLEAPTRYRELLFRREEPRRTNLNTHSLNKLTHVPCQSLIAVPGAW